MSQAQNGALSQSDVAARIDHTALQPDTTRDQIVRLCAEATEYGFAAVCLAPCWVETAAKRRAEEGAAYAIASVIGFPHGNTLPAAKAEETRLAVAAGAAELDMVMNIGRLKSGDLDAVVADIAAVVEAARGAGAHFKVILETALLTGDQLVEACRLTAKAGAHFVKTSTGFLRLPAGHETDRGDPTAPDWLVGEVDRMRRAVPDLGVKAAGGIGTRRQAERLIEAGADRLGCSRSVAIMREFD